MNRREFAEKCPLLAERPLTTLSHLIEDYQSTPAQRQERDLQHFVEWATFIDKLPPEQMKERVDFLLEIDYSIHFHTFTLHSFLGIIEYMAKEMGLPCQLIACADTLRHWVYSMGFEQNQEMSENSALKDQFDCGEKAHESRFVQTPVSTMLQG